MFVQTVLSFKHTGAHDVKVSLPNKKNIIEAQKKLNLMLHNKFPVSLASLSMYVLLLLIPIWLQRWNRGVAFRRPVYSHLYESVARSVVGDGETQSVFRLIHLHLLLKPFDVGENKILKADLAPQQLFHVNLVGVESTEQDLHTHEAGRPYMTNEHISISNYFLLN